LNIGNALHDVFLPENNPRVPISALSDINGRPYLLSSIAAQETLAPSLLLLYGEVEHTGHYEKVKYRTKISSILQYLWNSSEHRPAFSKITGDKESFINFANGIMNETNDLMSTVIEKLVSIRSIQQQMSDQAAWAALPQERRETIESQYSEFQEEVRYKLPLCNKTMQMLNYLNSDTSIRQLFLLDDMCPRLVALLMHVLNKLIGSKGLELKVNDMESYEFRPKEMLKDVCQIMALFSTEKTFHLECAKSGYIRDGKLVVQAVKTCQKLALLQGESMDNLASLPHFIDSVKDVIINEEKLMEGAPEEFLDPMMYTFMKDPVLLPSSGTICDRTTIMQHLLNNHTDPFNRKPLKAEDIVPALELKEKMDKWIEERRNACRGEISTD